MYAVIESGGKQYRVELGAELELDRLAAAPGDKIDLGRVLLIADGETATIGRPAVDGARVTAEVLRASRGDKIVVFKYRPKARHRAKQGHRQDLTVVRIADIEFDGRSAAGEAHAIAEREAKAKAEAERAAEAKAAADRALADKLARDRAEKAKADEGDTNTAAGKAKSAAGRTKAAAGKGAAAKAGKGAKTDKSAAAKSAGKGGATATAGAPAKSKKDGQGDRAKGGAKTKKDE